MRIKTLLEDEIVDRLGALKAYQVTEDDYKKGVDNVTKLISAAVEVERSDSEAQDKLATRMFEEHFKEAQMKEDHRNRIVSHVLTGLSIGLPILAASIVSIASMNFEREGTFTTEAGRNSIRHLLRFK